MIRQFGDIFLCESQEETVPLRLTEAECMIFVLLLHHLHLSDQSLLARCRAVSRLAHAWKRHNLEKHVDSVRDKLATAAFPLIIYRILGYGYIVLAS